MLIRKILLTFALLFSAHVQAFQAEEHKQLADLAYHVAITAYCGDDRNAPVCDRIGAEAWFFDPIANHSLVIKNFNKSKSIISYGDIVKCVDFFLTPDKLLAGREYELIRATAHDSRQHPKHGELYPESVKDLRFDSDPPRRFFDYDSRCNDDLTNLEGARSGHINHSHFQAELLIAQRTNHLLALMLKISDDNAFAALVANAISDHYLHDSFAPGHITTWRARLTDVAANAYHD